MVRQLRCRVAVGVSRLGAGSGDLLDDLEPGRGHPAEHRVALRQRGVVVDEEELRSLGVRDRQARGVAALRHREGARRVGAQLGSALVLAAGEPRVGLGQLVLDDVAGALLTAAAGVAALEHVDALVDESVAGGLVEVALLGEREEAVDGAGGLVTVQRDRDDAPVGGDRGTGRLLGDRLARAAGPPCARRRLLCASGSCTRPWTPRSPSRRSRSCRRSCRIQQARRGRSRTAR